MGTVFPRGKKLYIGFKGSDGKWCYRATGLEVGQEVLAKRSLAEVEKKVTAGVEAVGVTSGPLTVTLYLDKTFLGRRRTLDLVDYKNDVSRLRDYVRPVIGTMKLEEVRPRHVRQVIDRARVMGRAPRTIRNIYSITQAVFRDAVMEDLIAASPCILSERDLGEIVDKDPEWRGTAIYAREELVALVSDPRVPVDRQTMYALEGIGGVRHGEAAGLRWRNYECDQPLDALQVARSYKNKRGTKTQRARKMPVHPVLAQKLATWKTDGWVTMMGREPTPDDLICPCPAREKFAAGRMRDKNYSRKRLMEDLTALGLRHRRGHDLRRTMISLARRDGARKDLLEICTHTPSSSHAIDLYTEFEWSDLCGEVAKLRLTLEAPSPNAPEAAAAQGPDVTGYTAALEAALAAVSEAANDAEMPDSAAPFTTVLTSVDLPATPEPANYAQAQEFLKVAGVEAPGIEARFWLFRRCRSISVERCLPRNYQALSG